MKGVTRWFTGLAALPALPLVAFAADTLPTPTARVVETGFAKVVLEIDPGAMGAPGGFTVQWLKRTDFLANGQKFYPGPNAIQQEAVFTGTPTLNTWGGALTSFALAPGQKARVEIGDLLDETGLSATWRDELDVDKSWVFGVYLNSTPLQNRSATAPPAHGATRGGQNCTFTVGYWKNHPNVWPTSPMTLGTRSYTKAQLLAILQQPTQGNGLVSLARQAIATKLNAANGAADADVAAALTYADFLIGSKLIPPLGAGTLDPGATSSTTQALDDFNNGVIGPGTCATPVRPTTWGSVKSLYR